jgi:predicted dehydrogenase
MRFALLGSHPDGPELAAALVESGRHAVLAYTDALSSEWTCRLGAARRVADLEEVLADPQVEAVIVAGSPAVRPAQLRRALQAERHVLCVHPPDVKPDIAYEAVLIQQDTGYVLLPIMPAALHPAVKRLAEFVRSPAEVEAIGTFRVLDLELAGQGELLEGTHEGSRGATFPSWNVLRRLGGEIAEVAGFAEDEEVMPGVPVLLSGRFEQGGLFQVRLLPYQQSEHVALRAIGSRGTAELVFPQGWYGPAFLSWRGKGELREEAWEAWDPWPPLIEQFEAALQLPRPTRSEAITTTPQPMAQPARTEGRVSWQDCVRALELDDAARRSIERRRASTMEYPEASEEVGFKGTMVLTGCAMLWSSILLLILSHWFPSLRWLIVPLLILFLGLQLLRYVIPPRPDNRREP